MGKTGVHRPAAFAFWVSPPTSEPPYLPRSPRVGCAIYLPGLRFKLPWFLPDVNLADLGALGLPLPFIDVSYLQPEHVPEWFELEQRLVLKDWEGLGRTHDVLHSLFPDR